MQRKTRNTLLARILCMMLIVAMALFTVGCKKDEKETPQNGQETKVTAPAEDNQADTDAASDADQTEEAEKEDVASGYSVAELGEGKTSFYFKVTDKEGAEINFLIHTDKETVGDALLELGLIAGETSEYGLYVKNVNGIVADYDVDQTYWAFYINGEYAMSGVDSTSIEEGASYAFKVEK